MLLTAYEIGENEGYRKAVAWAERHGSNHVLTEIHILRANRDKADSTAWLSHVNTYLAPYDTSPLVLANSERSLLHRLSSTPRKIIAEGPLVSVIMCAYNAQDTIEMAARSILSQSWKPLELLIVDDCSTDGTASIALRLAKDDPRVRVHLNAANVGPYVGRNLALRHAKGQFITCHDADDWAHPERLAKQIDFLHREQLAGTISGMLRMRGDGHFVRPAPARKGKTDGWVRLAFVSALFERNAFDTHLGYWDSVRFGADSELVRRAELAFSQRMRSNPNVSMICLEHANSLTNHPVTGVSEKNGLSEARKLYVDGFKRWHATKARNATQLEFPIRYRPFNAPDESLVPYRDVIRAQEKSALQQIDHNSISTEKLQQS